MGNQYVIRDIPTSDKGILERDDEVIHQRFKLVNHKFGDNFINDIAKANRSKVRDLIREGYFGYESDIRVIFRRKP